MIIFGSKGITSTTGSGKFYCPSCDDERRYSKKKIRKFFTLYFIPLIPAGTLAEYVECNRCNVCFEPDVLDFDQDEAIEALKGGFNKAMRRAMIEMMLADGVIDADEITTIQDIYEQLSGQKLTMADIKKDIHKAEQQKAGLEKALAEVAPALNDEGREMVIKATFLVAAADGEFDESEIELLLKIGIGLGMSPAHIKASIDEMMQEGDD
jgi:tellurite resistance protein